jgi:CRP-like cAMP-binding protein
VLPVYVCSECLGFAQMTGDVLQRPADRLIRKFESIALLDDECRQAIMRLPVVVKELPADHDIVRIGDRPAECCLVLEGWTCRYKMLPEGGRQIMSFHIPGDVPDLQSLYLETMDHSLATMVPTTIALIQHRDMHNLIWRYEPIAVALWRESLIDASIFREWLVGIGRRSAHQRIAHLFCEMATKSRSVGLSEGDTYPWPVTQSELADALGLSDVHVNRVLSDLKRDGLITLGRRVFTAHDWDGLARLGQFDPGYLHLRKPDSD